MAFETTNLAAEPRAFSIGPIKIQIKTLSAETSDIDGTIRFDQLSELQSVVVTGITFDVAPTYSGNVATVGFQDPLGPVFGIAIGIGR